MKFGNLTTIDNLPVNFAPEFQVTLTWDQIAHQQIVVQYHSNNIYARQYMQIMAVAQPYRINWVMKLGIYSVRHLQMNGQHFLKVTACHRV